jgi:putative addiction module component (TIGR02574 family)
LLRGVVESLGCLEYQPVMSTLTFEEIARLSPPERLALIGDLWDSLGDAELPVAPAQRVELERRMDSFERDRAGS